MRDTDIENETMHWRSLIDQKNGANMQHFKCSTLHFIVLNSVIYSLVKAMYTDTTVHERRARCTNTQRMPEIRIGCITIMLDVIVIKYAVYKYAV